MQTQALEELQAPVISHSVIKFFQNSKPEITSLRGYPH